MSEYVWIGIYTAGTIVVGFAYSVACRVHYKKRGDEWDGDPPALVFGLIWPVAVCGCIVWLVITVFTHSADVLAERIAGGKETPDTLLRPSDKR